MVLQVQDIINDALGLCGAIAIDEAPSASEYAQALRTLNIMIDGWSTQRLMLRSTTALSIPIVASKVSYTVGVSGADVTAPKPFKLTSAIYRDSSGLDNPVLVYTVEDYNNLTDKFTSVGPPEYVAYDAGQAQQTVNTGTVYVYPSPDSAYTLLLETDCYLTEFASVSDTVTFEPAYYEALVYNLAVRLFRFYRDATVPVPQDIVSIATHRLDNLKALNFVNVRSAMDLPGGRGQSYNIYSDQG